MELNTKQNICRACLIEEGSFQSVFGKESSVGVSMNISEMLSACATIQVNEGDGLPDQLCSECSEQTVKMYLFKLMCKKSDTILRKRLEKRKVDKNKYDNIALKKNFTECEINEEMWEKNKEKISYEALKEKSKRKEFKSEIFPKNINQDNLLTNQEIFDAIKVEKLEIIDGDIEIKYNSISPMLMESRESLFPCLKCNSIFYEKKNLDEHISNLHIKIEPEVSCDDNLKRKQQIAEINSLLKNKPHGCDTCFKGFSQKSKLKKHMKTHTSISKQTGKQPFISNVVSNKGFNKSFKCDLCKKKFTDSSNLRRHRRIHTDEKPFECEICQKKFRHSSGLSSHIQIHSAKKLFECEVCKKRFKRLDHLTSHKRIHTGEKPYECDVCKRKFSHSSTLLIHKRLHSGEKPYECEVCMKRFITKGNLRRHKANRNCL